MTYANILFVALFFTCITVYFLHKFRYFSLESCCLYSSDIDGIDTITAMRELFEINDENNKSQPNEYISIDFQIPAQTKHEYTYTYIYRYTYRVKLFGMAWHMWCVFYVWLAAAAAATSAAN